MNIIYIGQGSNQACWLDGRERGRRHFPNDEARQLQFAEAFVHRLAITGAVGRKIAALLEVHPLEFYRDNLRVNLNKRWNGKQGKGDHFDMAEAKARVVEIIPKFGQCARVVLLGQNVVDAFGLDLRPLESTRYDASRFDAPLFFHLPHPSGLNRWWNSTENLLNARAKLKAFVEK